MTDERSLEGWMPAPTDARGLAQIIDHAFDYRGDVTLVMRDGQERVGYVCNRDPGGPEPHLELLEATADAPVAIPYACIRTIRFSGKDAASGKSYAAWLERKARPATETREAR